MLFSRARGSLWGRVRLFSDAPALSTPMDKPLAGAAATEASSSFERSVAPGLTRESTLSNGIRVISQARPDLGVGVSVFLDVGVRHETSSTRGVCHAIRRMVGQQGFGTVNAEELRRRLDSMGAMLEWDSAREHMKCSFQAMARDFDEMMEVLAGSMMDLHVTESGLRDVSFFLPYELDALARDHNQLLQERALNVAFQGSSLGHTLLPETEHLHNLTVDVVQSFMRECLVGSRMVVSGSGNVDHDALVRSVEQHFGALPAEGNHVLIDNTTRSLYRGGHFYEETLDVPHNPEHLPPLTHMMLLFPGFSWTQEECYAQHVLFVLLGGGNSFSSGGPGKGIYLRVLNRFPFINSATAAASSFTDAGYFSTYLNCTHDQTLDTLKVCIGQLFALMTDPYGEEELNRAKAQLKSLMVMNLESRGAVTEDLARSLLVYGRRVTPQEVCEKVDQVTPEDCRRAAESMLLHKGPPTLVALGQTGKLLPYDKLCDIFSEDTLQRVMQGQ